MSEKEIKKMPSGKIPYELYHGIAKSLGYRIKFNGVMYQKIIKDNYELYLKYEKQYEELQKTNPSYYDCEKSNELRFKNIRYELIVITFAGMFLECLIWDYAVTNSSISKTKLKNMGALEKWKVIPGLVNNKASINNKAFSLLKKLVTARNKIVHSKSKELPDTFEGLRGLATKSNRDVHEAVKCVNSCIKALKKIDTTNYWYFNDEDFPAVYFIQGNI